MVTVKETIAATRERFHRDAWLGYYGNGWRSDRKGYRKLLSNIYRVLNTGVPDKSWIT